MAFSSSAAVMVFCVTSGVDRVAGHFHQSNNEHKAVFISSRGSSSSSSGHSDDDRCWGDDHAKAKRESRGRKCVVIS